MSFDVNRMNYVGYGPNNDPEMIEAITGEPPIDVGRFALILGAQLCVQRLEDVPDKSISPELPSVRQILTNSWGEDSGFEAYALRSNIDGFVRGTPYVLSDEALPRIWEWELTDLGWFVPRTITTVVPPGPTLVGTKTEIINSNQTVNRVVEDSINYPDFLMPKDWMLEKARQARTKN